MLALLPQSFHMPACFVPTGQSPGKVAMSQCPDIRHCAELKM